MNKQSKVIPLRTPEVIDHEAADWLARLDSGKLSRADRSALRDWIAQDASHAMALKGMATIWSDMDSLLNDSERLHQEGNVSLFALFDGFRIQRPAFAVLSIALVAILASTLMLNTSVEFQTAFYVTAVGDQRIETFEDGSTAHLNTDSMIETEFTESFRIIRLLRGEALFDVTHDPDRPFVVYVGDRRVQAIGTRFVVRLTSENIVVTVTEGQVELCRRNEEVDFLAGAGDQALVATQEVVLISEGETIEVLDRADAIAPEAIEDEEMDRRLSWASGQLVFKNETLEQVINEVARYVPVTIVIDDQELRDVLVSGRFQVGDTEALLEAIEVSLSIRADRDEQVIRLVR